MIIFIACLSTSSSSCDHFVSERGWGDWYSGEHIDNPHPLNKGQHLYDRNFSQVALKVLLGQTVRSCDESSPKGGRK